MGGFRLDAGRCGTVAELLDDPLSGVSFSRRGGRPLDCGQLLDPAKSLFAGVLSDSGSLPAVGLGDCCSAPPTILFQAAGGEPSAAEISSSAWFSASLICLPPMPRNPPSLCALATACAAVITNLLYASISSGVAFASRMLIASRSRSDATAPMLPPASRTRSGSIEGGDLTNSSSNSLAPCPARASL